MLADGEGQEKRFSKFSKPIWLIALGVFSAFSDPLGV
jgi:hypothetical protein